MRRTLGITFVLAAAAVSAADHPTVEIRNGEITAKLYLPDPQEGYYRGTRFDWSGALYSLIYDGHEYFGEWQTSDDPHLHDRITGPVEEYRTAGKGLGYDEAAPGGTFLRIGVGVVEKPEEADYRWRHSYRVVDPGQWSVEKGQNWIALVQQVQDQKSGYGYRLTKRLTLTPGKPELVIDHALANIGSKTIETSVYNHNFFVIDGRPTGPEFLVRFPFEPTADRDLRGYATIVGKELVYRKEIPEGESIITLLEGYGPTAEDHGFAIENRATGAGVRLRADKPLARLQFWSPSTTLCPEPYIDLRIEPGQADRWSLHYEFYTLPE